MKTKKLLAIVLVTALLTALLPAMAFAEEATVTAIVQSNFGSLGVPLKATYSTTTTYQWYKDGTEINGATDQLYYADAEGSYTCTDTGSAGVAGFTVTQAMLAESTPIGASTAMDKDHFTDGNTVGGTIIGGSSVIKIRVQLYEYDLDTGAYGSRVGDPTDYIYEGTINGMGQLSMGGLTLTSGKYYLPRLTQMALADDPDNWVTVDVALSKDCMFSYSDAVDTSSMDAQLLSILNANCGTSSPRNDLTELNMARVTSLTLADCDSIAGGADLSALGNFTRVEEIMITGSAATRLGDVLAALPNTANVTTLTVGNAASLDAAAIDTHLTGVTGLTLTGANNAAMASFASMALESLRLESATLTDLSSLSAQSGTLTLLSIDKSTCADYSALAHLTKLKYLFISSSNFKNADVSHLAPLDALIRLSLSDMGLTDISAIAGHTYFSGLEHLSFAKNHIVDITFMNTYNTGMFEGRGQTYAYPEQEYVSTVTVPVPVDLGTRTLVVESISNGGLLDGVAGTITWTDIPTTGATLTYAFKWSGQGEFAGGGFYDGTASLTVKGDDTQDPPPIIPVYFTITATAETGGSITPAGSTSVFMGTSQSYAMVAEDGYAIKDVLVDGVSVGARSSYTFMGVTSNHTIHVRFETTTTDTPDPDPDPDPIPDPDPEFEVDPNGNPGAAIPKTGHTGSAAFLLLAAALVLGALALRRRQSA